MIIEYDLWKHQVPKIFDNESKFIIFMVEKSWVASRYVMCQPIDSDHTRTNYPIFFFLHTENIKDLMEGRPI